MPWDGCRVRISRVEVDMSISMTHHRGFCFSHALLHLCFNHLSNDHLVMLGKSPWRIDPWSRQAATMIRQMCALRWTLRSELLTAGSGPFHSCDLARQKTLVSSISRVLIEARMVELPLAEPMTAFSVTCLVSITEQEMSS